MSAEAAVLAGRDAAAQQMWDTFTAFSYEWWEEDDLSEQIWVERGDALGKVPNKRAGGDASSARTVNVGGVERIVVEGGLHLAWDASPSPTVGMEYVLTKLGPTTHPSMLNKRYKVVETHPTSAMTAWRLDVVDVTPPEEA